MSREPTLDDLIDETTGVERQRLEHVHDLLLQAGPPPELPPGLRQAPDFGVVPLQQRRRTLKRRAFVLLAAALSIAVVFFAGYAVASHNGGGSTKSTTAVESLRLAGTSGAPGARATLDVWSPQDGNWPMTLDVSGLPKLPARTYYEVYLVRHGRILGSCGTFRVAGPQAVTLTLNAPYPLQRGDSWIVTRQGPGGAEPGRPVLRPVAA